MAAAAKPLLAVFLTHEHPDHHGGIAERKFIAVAKNILKGDFSDPFPGVIRSQVEARYPGYLPVAEIPDLIDVNAETVAAELSGEQQS